MYKAFPFSLSKCNGSWQKQQRDRKKNNERNRIQLLLITPVTFFFCLTHQLKNYNSCSSVKVQVPLTNSGQIKAFSRAFLFSPGRYFPVTIKAIVNQTPNNFLKANGCKVKKFMIFCTFFARVYFIRVDAFLFLHLLVIISPKLLYFRD